MSDIKITKERIEKYFREIMLAMNLPVDEDPSIVKTPKRVAKMFTDEIFKGLLRIVPLSPRSLMSSTTIKCLSSQT